MERIGLYTQTTKFTTEHAGTAEWCKAERDGRQYFVKKFHSPVYPSKDIGLSEKMYKAGVEEFHEALTAKRDIYDHLRKCDQTGILVVPIEVLNYQFHICTIADFVTGNVSSEQVHLLSEWQRLILMRTLTLALMNVHMAGVVHSDMKPDNVLITQDQNGHCKLRLIDFDGSFIEANPPTDPEDVVGDPTFFSPEAYNLSMDEDICLDHRIDVFALGIIFHYYWCGKLPQKPEDQTIGECILRGGSVTLDESIPQVIKQLIQKMISANPDQRIALKQVYDVLGVQIERYPKLVVKLQLKEKPATPKTTEVRIEFRTEGGDLLKYRPLKLLYDSKKTVEAEEIKGYQLVGSKTKEIFVDAKGHTTSPVTFSYRKENNAENKNTGRKVLGIIAALFVLYWIIMCLLSMSAFNNGEWSKAIQYMDYTPFFSEVFSDTYQDTHLHLIQTIGTGKADPTPTPSPTSPIQTVGTGNSRISVSAGRIARVKFTAPSRGTYIFTSTGTEDTVGYLYNSATTSTTLAENDDYNGSNQFYIEYTMNANQSVFIGVKYFDSSRSGTISLNISRKADPTPTPSPTSPIQTVGTGNSRISVSAGRIARVKFTAPSRGTYIFTSTGTEDTVGYLYNSATTSTTLAENDDYNGSNQFYIEYTMNANQAIYLGVKFYSSDRSGSISVSITKKSESSRSWPVGSTCRVISSIANARAGAGTSYDVVEYVYEGNAFTILDYQKGNTEKDWYKINVNGKICWISSGLVEVDGYREGTINGIPVNYRT